MMNMVFLANECFVCHRSRYICSWFSTNGKMEFLGLDCIRLKQECESSIMVDYVEGQIPTQSS
jgi:hypothetical protein